MIHYRDFNLRYPDHQYRDLLSRILRSPKLVHPQQGEDAFKVFGHLIRFDMENGFPIITERDLVAPGKKTSSIFNQSLGEITAFLNGAQTQEELVKFGCSWWDRWVTPEKCAKRGLAAGDLGPGSYGAAWRRFPTAEGKPFDQITNLIEQMKELPHLRTHFVSPWVPQYTFRGKGKQQKVVVAPCHGWFDVELIPDKKEFSLFHLQRSADVPVGLVCNIIQYAALTLMLAQVTGYRAKELVYAIIDAHIYVKQVQDVKDMLQTEPQRFSTVELDQSVTDIFSFRPEHFTVKDYHPQLERRRIWTPV